MSHERLFLKAVTAFLVLPGTVAFLVPWLIRPDVPPRWNGVPPFGLGLIVLLWCVRDFYVAGKGSLAPWAPPVHLVRVGLYRYSRNPMYIGVLLILLGWAMAFGGRTLWLYAAGVAIAFHLRVVLGEEPWLAGTHGEAWSAYQERVPRWFT